MCWLAVGYFSYLMILITMQYVPIKLDVAFLNIKQEELSLRYYPIAFFTHVYTSIFVLLLGLIQFAPGIRNLFPKAHRTVGKIYVFLVLILASPSGFIIALHANGGWYSRISFVIQAVLWFVFTYQAYLYALRKKWGLHRNFMMRSFALTLSAISLRLFKWLIVGAFELPPMDTYRIVSWLGWLINLAVVEVYILVETRTNK